MSSSKIIYFYSHHGDLGYLSNFYPCFFKETSSSEYTYNCSEQFFMKKKQELFDSNNKILSQSILSETNPSNIKIYGRKVCNYNDKEWERVRYDIMYTALILKFSQNPNLLKKLLETGSSILVEASPYDGIWGIKQKYFNGITDKDWKGQNLLGKCLMEVRSKLITF